MRTTHKHSSAFERQSPSDSLIAWHRRTTFAPLLCGSFGLPPPLTAQSEAAQRVKLDPAWE